MSHILVTGSTGFLGRHLCPVLEAQGHEVTKLNSKKFCFDIKKRQFDYIYHLAAYTQAGDWCLTHSGDQWLRNETINSAILTYWKCISPNAKLITIGSSCAYAPGVNLVEENYMKGEPHESLYTYAMTKRMLYDGCRALNKQYGMKYLYLVPSTLYGANYHTDGRQAHFIFDLIRKIIRGKELGEKVILWGDGSQVRDVIHVDEFVHMMLYLNSRYDNEIVNISGDTRTIREFAEEICQIVGYDASKIEYDETRHVGTQNKSLNCDKSFALFGHRLDTLLECGLTDTICWYKESGAWR